MAIPELSAISYLKRENGVPSSQVQDLAFDRPGRLWMATPSGLACYDGSRVRSYSRQQGLRSHGLRGVTCAPDGVVWAGSDAGYDRLRDDRALVPDDATGPWRWGYVDCLYSKDDVVWLGTASGLVCFDGYEFRGQDNEGLKNGAILTIREGQDGRLWVATADHGVYYQAHGRWVGHDNREWRDLGPAISLAAGPRNDMLVGTPQGFVEVSKSGYVRARQESASSGQPVRCMALIGEELWTAIGDRLCVFRRMADTWHLQRVVLSGQLINTILPDRFGNVWAASESHGAAKISVLGDVIRHLPMANQQAVFAVREARHDRMLVAGERATCYRSPSDDREIENIPALAGQEVWDIYEEPNGALFAATANGLWYLDASHRAKQLGVKHPVLAAPNRCIAKFHGRTFVGTTAGCVTIDDQQVIGDVVTRGNEPLGYVYTLETDRRGRLWLGTVGNGLWIYEDDEFRRYEHELLSESGSTYAIDTRSDGRIAFVQDNRIYLLSAEDELTLLTETSDPIAGWAIRFGTDGTLWTGSSSGLVQYSTLDGRQLKQVTSLLGISNWEFTNSRSLYMHESGRYYCGVNSGLVEVDTRAIAALPDMPAVAVSSLQWERVEPKEKNGQYILPFSRWTVSVEVFAGWFIDESDVQYRFRLTGFDEDWRELQGEASISLNTLPPGEYQLEAQAYNRLVGYGPASTLMSLKVSKPRWLRRLVFAPIASFTEMRRIGQAVERNRSLNRQNIQLQQLVEERTADLELARQRLEDINRELANQSITDALTGIGNRRLFDEQLQQAINDARRDGKPLSLLLLDVDYFKPYNDIYGHAKGDDCLSFVARKLVSSLFRPEDQVARYGGEEFVVLLPDASAEGAASVAERLRAGIEDLGIEHRGQPDTACVTISVGITTWEPEPGLSDSEITALLVETADAALYEAKAGGRNCCRSRAI